MRAVRAILLGTEQEPPPTDAGALQGSARHRHAAAAVQPRGPRHRRMVYTMNMVCACMVVKHTRVHVRQTASALWQRESLQTPLPPITYISSATQAKAG